MSHGILLFSGHDFDERYFAQYKGTPYTNGRGHYPIEYSVIVNAGWSHTRLSTEVNR